MHAGNLDSY
jgi:hypothetical protein